MSPIRVDPLERCDRCGLEHPVADDLLRCTTCQAVLCYAQIEHMERDLETWKSDDGTVHHVAGYETWKHAVFVDGERLLCGPLEKLLLGVNDG